MNRQRMMVWGILGVILVITLVLRFRGGTGPKKATVQSPAPVQAAIQAPATGQPSPAPITPPVQRYLSLETVRAWRATSARLPTRDPFLTVQENRELALPPPIRREAKLSLAEDGPRSPLPDYRVRVIVISRDFKVASLNGTLVSEGESIGGERVVAIREHEVILDRDGARRTIRMTSPNRVPMQVR